MSNRLYENLSWLPCAPEGFTAQCRELSGSPEDFGRRLQKLAGYSLDENQLNRLARIIANARQAGFSFAPLTAFRLGIMSNATTDLILPALMASAARHGIALECFHTDYNQTVQEALNPDSIIYREKCDAVLIAVDFRGIPFHSTPGNADEAQRTALAALGYFATIRSAIKEHSRAICIVQTIPAPVESLFG